MRHDDTAKTVTRPSSTTVRLFNGLGGVELGVRQTRRKAMVFVRVRKIVIAMWWKGDHQAPAARPAPGRVAADRPGTMLEAGSGGHPAGHAGPSIPAEIDNAMRLLWRRFSAVFKGGR